MQRATSNKYLEGSDSVIRVFEADSAQRIDIYPSIRDLEPGKPLCIIRKWKGRFGIDPPFNGESAPLVWVPCKLLFVKSKLTSPIL